MSEQPDSIGTGGNLGAHADKIPNYAGQGVHYKAGRIVLGTDGNLWQQCVCLGSGVTYWQRVPVLNVETMEMEHKS